MALLSQKTLQHQVNACNFCLDQLKSVYHKLCSEEVGNLNPQALNKYLIPFLLYIKDDSAESSEILDTTIKILTKLIANSASFNFCLVNQEIFSDTRIVRAVTDHMKFIIENNKTLNGEQCNSLNNSLLFLSNILFLFEKPCHAKNRIVWTLFSQNIDKIVIYLISSPKKAIWTFTIAQFLALLYKSYPTGLLQKEMNSWIESTLNDSTDESSTLSSSDFTPTVTDSCRKKLDRADSGYATQVENQENESCIFFQQMFQLNQSLFQRTKTIRMRKELRYHSPRDEDVIVILTEFTIDFLLKSYNTLVKELYFQFSENEHIDMSHLFWLVSYFLKYAAQMELPLESLNCVLSQKLLHFLASQVLKTKMRTRQLHLAVLAILEFLRVLDSYQNMIHLSKSQKSYLFHLQAEICGLKELKSAILLLINKYDPKSQSREFLKDLVVLNHNYLLVIEKITSDCSVIFEYLQEFSTLEMMKPYGFLLENFEGNGRFLNDCLLTMMHHISGSLGNVSALFQPGILRAFDKISEADFDLKQEWTDLIHFVTYKFLNGSKENSELEQLLLYSD